MTAHVKFRLISTCICTSKYVKLKKHACEVFKYLFNKSRNVKIVVRNFKFSMIVCFRMLSKSGTGI